MTIRSRGRPLHDRDVLGGGELDRREGRQGRAAEETAVTRATAIGGLLLAILTIACDSPNVRPKQRSAEEVAREKEQHRRSAQRDALVAQVAARFNADSDWFKGSPFRWTAAVQNALQRPDGRPVAGIARLRDIARGANGEYIVRLEHGSRFAGPTITFALDCSRDRSSESVLTAVLDGNSKVRGIEYVFVATVGRVVLDPTAHRSDEIVELRGPHWVATGDCVALQAVVDQQPSRQPSRQEGRSGFGK